jgi:SRSO17 transposase
MMALSRVNGRGIGLSDQYLPTQNMAFGKRGIVYRMADGDLSRMPLITEPQPSFLPSPFPLRSFQGSLQSFAPVKLEMVSHSRLEALWDSLVRQYHYLGYQRLLGHRLKYLAFLQGHPVAALSFSAPALKLAVRDRYIGWSASQRKLYLHHLANNSRFLILPGVQIPHLASHVLSLTLRRLNQDWQQYFHTRLWLLETFVDPGRFQGTSYRAANWRDLGPTSGFGKQGIHYTYHGSCKEVYLYVLEPDFRQHIGCQPLPPVHRPTPSQKKAEELAMILRHADWSPELVPWVKLTQRDLQDISQELILFHQQFHACYGRLEHRRLGLSYLSGLLSNLEAKSVEPIALAFLDDHAVRPLQQFLKVGRWHHEQMENQHQILLSDSLSSPKGMITADSSEFPKKGKESVGVARQYCGATGKVDNCQSGVFIGYSSSKGYGLLTSQLYMPKEWFTPDYAQRRKDNLVPEDLPFQTKPQIALSLIQKVVPKKLFAAQWIGCDAIFGSDPDFLASLPKELYYLANIRSKTQVFLQKPKVGLPRYSGRGPRPKKLKVLRGQPQPKTVAQIAKSRKTVWHSLILAEGAKGPIRADLACLRVFPAYGGLPQENSLWLLIRRTADGKIKYAFSNAPEDLPLSELADACTLRWGIEQCFEDGKGFAGMGQYEHRSWPAWQRHMIYVFLALHFLLRLRLRFKKNSSADSTSSSQIARSCSSASIPEPQGSNKNSQIPYAS